ncbi:photoreceptor disk component PRCD isoform X1 [Canis lupus dingo]|uniref:photoreceptor disk component PRCD isoform X2 n=1 Tax=Canis lupus familiaris TaxID=9615 RepID=UPI0018F7D60F|nr:photoreceptor disk component PRCD isoform X2 [Canis lupus familiaris]XP_048969850.1 photoreceptor disk component PRCD isoform X1 [Canis lupus dingo]
MASASETPSEPPHPTPMFLGLGAAQIAAFLRNPPQTHECFLLFFLQNLFPSWNQGISLRSRGAQRSRRGSRGQQVGERPPVLGQKGRASEVSLHPVRRSSAPGTGISWQRQFKSRLASYPQSMLWWKQQQQQEEKWEKAVIKKVDSSL